MRKTEDIIFGEITLRIQQTNDAFIGVVVGNASERYSDATRDGLISKLKRAVGESKPEFIGYEGARRRFLEFFPRGFRDENYIGDNSFGEQRYKTRMATKLNEEFPLDGWQAVANPTETALRMFRSTNLIDPFTKTAIQNVLRSSQGIRFLEICTEFAQGQIEQSTKKLLREFKNEGVAKWPALTYLPFFWMPDEHMFLKPKFTREYAERVGHAFVLTYESTVNEVTYTSLLDLPAETKAQISQIEGPDDINNIDVHSFMWVVIDYKDTDVGPPDA